MRRSLWFVAGASAGVYAAARARRAAEMLTVDGLRDRVGAVVVGARMFRDEVAQGKADAETGLRDRMALGLHEHGKHRELGAAPDDLPADDLQPPTHTSTHTPTHRATPPNIKEEGTS